MPIVPTAPLAVHLQWFRSWQRIQRRHQHCRQPDSYKWFIETAVARAPSWRNEVTLRTIEYAFGYEPGAYIGLISPTPLLLIVAVNDHLAVSDLAIAAYERAFEPKKLVLLPGGHFEAYIEAFDQSSGPACDWFREHLR